MTKKQVYADFMENVYPEVVAHYGRSDRIALREEWNNYTDMLCKNMIITSHQYETWDNPF